MTSEQVALRAVYRPMDACGYAAQYVGEAPESYVVEWDVSMMRIEFTNYDAARRCFLAYAGREDT